MSENEEVVSVRSRGLTEDEAFSYDAYRRQPEASLARANDALRQFVTLGTAMTAGALVLLKEDVCHGWWRVAAAGLSFVALGVAVAGSVPAAVGCGPLGVTAEMARVARAKKGYVRVSSALLLAGLLAALVGAVVRTARG